MTKRIRVLFTIPNLNTAGSGMALYKLLTNLDKELFEPHVLCLHSKGTLFQKFADAGIAMHVLEYTHEMRPLIQGLRHSWRVSRWIKNHDFKVVYSYHYASDYSEPLAAKFAGSKWLFVKKNMSWFGPSHKAWRLRSFLADRIIIQNKEMKRIFYPKSSKAMLISIGVDTGEFYPLNYQPNHLLAFNKSEKTKVIGVVANFVPVKGLEILIKAFKLLSINYDFKLVLVGDNNNDYGKQLAESAKELNFPEKRIFFAGRQTNINEWLNVFDLYVQPSIGQGEGSPVAVQEAISAGTLVIGSQICGIEDQLSDTPELLFEPGSSKSLAAKIEFVFSLNDKATALLKDKQKQHLLENYTLEAEVKAVEKNLISMVT